MLLDKVSMGVTLVAMFIKLTNVERYDVLAEINLLDNRSKTYGSPISGTLQRRPYVSLHIQL